MNPTDQSISCPVCDTKIPFNPYLLLKGQQFTCPAPGCGATIGLSPPGRDVVDESMSKFQEMKSRIQDQADDQD